VLLVNFNTILTEAGMQTIVAVKNPFTVVVNSEPVTSKLLLRDCFKVTNITLESSHFGMPT